MRSTGYDTLIILTLLYCDVSIFRYFKTPPTDEALPYYLIFYTKTFVNLPSLHQHQCYNFTYISRNWGSLS